MHSSFSARELRNAAEPSTIHEDTAYIHPSSLRSLRFQFPRARRAGDAIPDRRRHVPGGARALRCLLVQALEKINSNQTQATRLLRITRDTLRYKMKKFN